MSTASPLRLHAAPLGFTDGQLEAIKWLGMASMLLDHIGRHLMGFAQHSWVFALGRIAFPCFVFVLAVNLAREGDRAGRCARTTLRLGLWGAVAVLPSIWARGDPTTLNVLFTLSLGAALCWALEGTAAVWLRALACVAIAAVAWFAEFGVGGVFMVPAIYLCCTQREPAMALVAALLLLATAWLNTRFGGWPAFAGTLATVPIVWGLRALPVKVPRWQPLFYLIYPLHLAVIGALKAQG
ncbi:MAG TPA: TraX family protein [Ramlibacter sp.]|nr:TraX family protein [Ramlibacter sp.]